MKSLTPYVCAIALCLVGCVSESPRTVPPEALRVFADTASRAVAVYHCSVKNVGEVAEYRVKEVWRHRSSLGASPAIGDEVLRTALKKPVEPSVTSVLVFIYDPPISDAKGTLIRNRTVYAFGNFVHGLHLTLAETERMVKVDAKG